MPSPFPWSPAICECSWTKTQKEKKKRKKFKFCAVKKNYKYALCFCIFVMIVLCNWSANFWFGVTSNFIPPPKDFSSENLWTVESNLPWYPSYCGLFAVLNALSGNTSQKLFLSWTFFWSVSLIMLKTWLYLIHFNMSRIPCFFTFFICSLFLAKGLHILDINMGCLKGISCINYHQKPVYYFIHYLY